MRRRTLLGAGCGLLLAPALARADTEGELDLLLVLAADVSQSMREQELRMQREGYAAALRDRDVQRAICAGPCGSIGLLYMEWSGADDQQVLVPWMRLGSAADADGFAARIAAAPQRVGHSTSISGAIGASRRLLANAPFAAERRVVDISGDGENNSGMPAESERDLAVAEGVTLNGLPILRDGPQRGGSPEGALERHYREAVTGGVGSFVLPAQGFDAFPGAIRRKLVMEIAGRPTGLA